MEDLTIVVVGTLVGTLVGVLIGYLLGIITDLYRQKKFVEKYRTILYFELKRLKESIPDGLDQVIQRYDSLIEQQQRQFVLGQPYSGLNPADYIKRWSFRNKYFFLHNNFEKISSFDAAEITSILVAYSYLEEFEEYKQLAISDPDAFQRIKMGDPELLLIGDLKKAQTEIVKVLPLLESKKGSENVSDGGEKKADPDEKQILIEIRDLLREQKNESDSSNFILLSLSFIAAFIAWVALSLAYLQSLSAIEFSINQSSNQSMFVNPLLDQQRYFISTLSFQYPIYAIAALWIILGFYLLYRTGVFLGRVLRKK